MVAASCRVAFLAIGLIANLIKSVQPTSTCADDPEGWSDRYGSKCSWYAALRGNRCDRFGDRFSNFGKTAREACCTCGGGKRVHKKETGPSQISRLPPPSPIESPARYPDESSSTVCVNSPDYWHDPTGKRFNCNFYGQRDRCERMGGSFSRNYGVTANEACCACGGGEMVEKKESVPIPESPHQQQGGVCVDSPKGWYDPTGELYNCEWYRDNSRCERLGDYYRNFGVTANQACCVCGGGQREATEDSETQSMSQQSPSPTPQVTLLPTRFPTSKPTSSPTSHPTPRVTRRPTPNPTPSPTAEPSAMPTLQPSHSPTSQPTVRPTPSPTTKPTSSPTTGSTFPPSPSPTSNPTASPTPSPTREPTSSPTPLSTQASPSLKSFGKVRSTGQQCSRNSECRSSTCRNGVCMASADCFPVKHKYGTPFDTNSINLVFVGSSFNSTTHDAWRSQVQKTYQTFRNYKMFSEDIEQLNVFLVDPFELSSSFCYYGCMGIDRLLCCDEDKAQSLSRKCFPIGANLQTIVIHNDRKYGGAGYTDDNIATMSTHRHAPFVAIHELGHSLFELADEYVYGDGTDEHPNCAASRDCSKWSDLIGNTPSGYKPVSCMPGCFGGKYFVGGASYMRTLNRTVGAVNERFSCCTYQALTKSMPSYCDVFNFATNYLFDYCKNNDYQHYGASNYDVSEKLNINANSIHVALDENVKYVYVTEPMLVKVKFRKNGRAVVKEEPVPLPPGMYHKTQVQGEFSRSKDAAKKGFESYVKVKVFYSSGKDVLLFSQNKTVEVPVAVDGSNTRQSAPRKISRKSRRLDVVVDTKGRTIKKVRALETKTSKTVNTES